MSGLFTEILKNLVARDSEERTVLQSVIQFAQSPNSGINQEIPQMLTALSEESRTHFFGLVEAIEIYQSIHGTASALLSLNDAAVAELRKIRDICLSGGAQAYY